MLCLRSMIRRSSSAVNFTCTIVHYIDKFTKINLKRKVRERYRKTCRLTILTGFIPYKQELDCENIKNEHRFST